MRLSDLKAFNYYSSKRHWFDIRWGRNRWGPSPLSWDLTLRHPQVTGATKDLSGPILKYIIGILLMKIRLQIPGSRSQYYFKYFVQNLTWWNVRAQEGCKWEVERRLHSEELYSLYRLRDIVRVIKFKILRWAVRVPGMEEGRSVFKVFNR